MQALEFTKDNRHGIAIIVLGPSYAVLQEKFTQVKQALLDWADKRAETGRLVAFTVLAPPLIHEEVEEFLAKVCSSERDLVPIFDRMHSIAVSLLDTNGKVIKEYKIK